MKYLNWLFIRFEFVKKTSISHPVGSLEYINCPGSRNPRPIKRVAILLKTTVRRSGDDQEDLKPYTENRKEVVPPGDQQVYYLWVFQRFY